MKVYILTDEPYHDNEFIYGVFSSVEKAQAANMMFKGSSRIVEVTLDAVDMAMVAREAATYGKREQTEATVEYENK